ncbi:MAG TPA: lyase family protein [Spirochaetota bacterium]|nr:lyase family protein [Spirochaetota bacterium]HOM38009.1 lyase family protein [Spirochaetota bacterium]HPQ48813.1 lyase family protein [Spirochaetota bacterium]
MQYFGKETEKAIKNFGKGLLPPELIKAYGEVKLAVLSAVQEIEKKYTKEEWEALQKTCFEVIENNLDENFILPLLQGGAGTSINMNVNEVIANRANQILGKDRFHPIEDINVYQSTNDTFPTAVTITLYRKLLDTEKLVINLQETLIKKENQFSKILMTGRTEMQDALPITLGQVFASWAGMIERDRWRIHKLKERIRVIPLGGTAIGTGYPAPSIIVFASEKFLREITTLPLSRSQNLPDEVANQDKWSELASVIKIIAENLYKITGDLLLYTSSFIDEIKHPDLQYGSTIMAAKTNPVILEYVRGLSISIKNECLKISEFTSNGQLQLNPYLPFILESFLRVFDYIEKSIISFIDNFLNQIEINKEKIEENLVKSNILLNGLIGILGYQKVKEIYILVKEKKTTKIAEIKNIIKEKTDLTYDEIEFYLDPINISSFFRLWRKQND